MEFTLSKTGDFKFGSWRMHRVSIQVIMDKVREIFDEHGLPCTDAEVLDMASDIKGSMGGFRLRDILWISNYAAEILDPPADITYSVFVGWRKEYDRMFSWNRAGYIRDQMLEYLRHNGSFPAADNPDMPKGYAAWLEHVGYKNPERIKIDLTIER